MAAPRFHTAWTHSRPWQAVLTACGLMDWTRYCYNADLRSNKFLATKRGTAPLARGDQQGES